MNEKIYSYMNWPRIEAVVYGEETSPRDVMGPKITKDGVLVQGFFPDAQEVDVISGGKTYPCEMEDEAGYFAALLPLRKVPDYKFSVKTGEEIMEFYDPYSFACQITEEEEKAFCAGVYYEAYKKLEAENEKVHVVYWDGVFNYSAINNYGASFARGEYFLLLNNDTEIINPNCLEELLGYCMRSDVGAVGARLYYEDDTIQHAGVVIGFGGIAGHCFVLQPRGTTGYCHRIICAQDYSAVTAACMMVKRTAFEEVGGLSEELQVAFNDIDFCMKLRKAGYLIVYNPYAELYHYESKSRGLEDTPEKVARFNREISVFEKRWPDILRNGDPYYNPNLTLKSQDFSLKRI